MSMTGYITNLCKQDAVYWAPTGQDTYETTYDSPADIKCRWVDKGELFQDEKGEEVLSNSIVHVLQDVLVGGYLWLGTVDALDSGVTDPKDVVGARPIKKVEKIPSINNDAFVRRVFL